MALVESPTLALFARVNDIKAKGQDVIEFYIGEPDFGIPPNVASSIKDAIDLGKTNYTHQAGLPELREAISAYYDAQFGLKFAVDNIVVTAGPKDTIYKLIGTIVDPGDKVVVMDPHWEAYGEQVGFFEGCNIFVPRDRDNLSYRLDYLEDALRQRPKALVFNDPDNPTGYKAGTEELEAIADMARRYGVIVLSDEIYWLHCYDTEFKSIAHFYPEGTIILSGVSKAWAGTGLRLGFAMFPEELRHVSGYMARVTGQASSSVNTPTQWGFFEAFSDPATRIWEREMVEEFKSRRDIVEEIIGDMLGYALGGAFYAAPKTPINGLDFSERLLREEHVCVLPLSTLTSGDHEYFEDRVRIAYVTDKETLKEGLSRFRRFSESITSAKKQEFTEETKRISG